MDSNPEMRAVFSAPEDTPDYSFVLAVMTIVADKINARMENGSFTLYPVTRNGGAPIRVLCDTEHILDVDPRGSITFKSEHGGVYRLSFSRVKTTVEHPLPPCLEEVITMFGEKAFKNIPFSTQ